MITVFKKKEELFFILLLLLHCASIGMGWNLPGFITKLSLVPYLLLLLYLFSRKQRLQLSPLPILALLFSFVGDLALSFTGELSFLFGMGAFMLTHIFNARYFWKLQKNSHASIFSRMLAALLMILVSATIFMALAPYLGKLTYPIIIYMGLISVMAVLALGTIEADAVKQIGTYCFIPGALLFVLSDALLALNRFVLHKTVFAVLVMLTYGMAQFFFVRGYGMVTTRDL